MEFKVFYAKDLWNKYVILATSLVPFFLVVEPTGVKI